MAAHCEVAASLEISRQRSSNRSVAIGLATATSRQPIRPGPSWANGSSSARRPEHGRTRRSGRPSLPRLPCLPQDPPADRQRHRTGQQGKSSAAPAPPAFPPAPNPYYARAPQPQSTSRRNGKPATPAPTRTTPNKLELQRHQDESGNVGETDMKKNAAVVLLADEGYLFAVGAMVQGLARVHSGLESPPYDEIVIVHAGFSDEDMNRLRGQTFR